ncbi:uncharacterized protein EHS24_004046 [Apiotrichum porosum]|uniref:Thioredoxin domain-containing protein n=1 Tax=Apiotrichum porosum TaxID=105984 RepID=A0A427Y469_9TREE|nr:uncharacterized protein EHS24_004046 [Apiotrichum porosum]RSH85865.1 hypothetical protein EHS24_004046 [Apiotrichum porosum]
MHWSALTLALAALATAPQLFAAGMYREPVKELDSKSWNRVMSVEHASMVAFVAPWCGHCKNLGPEFSSAAQSLAPLIPFYTVNCNEEANRRLCAEHDVKGYPTIKAFPRGKKGAARPYEGQRNRGPMVEYAKSLIPERVKKYRADEGGDAVVTKFLDEKPALPHALLVHPSAPSIPFLWKVLGHRLSGKMFLGYVRDTPKHEVLSTVGVYDAADKRDTARLVYWPVGASRAEVVEYDGALKFNAILEWLEAHLSGTPLPSSSADKPKGASEPEPAASDASKARASATDKATDDADAKRRAKLEESERRDRLRREKLAAKQAAEQEQEDEEAASPVDAPAPEPVEEDEAEPQLDIPVESPHAEHEEVAGEQESGTPVDAPEPEVAEDFEEEAEEEKENVHDEL